MCDDVRHQVLVPRGDELGLRLAAEASHPAGARREPRALLRPAPHLLPQEQPRARPAALRAPQRRTDLHLQRVLLQLQLTDLVPYHLLAQRSNLT